MTNRGEELPTNRINPTRAIGWIVIGILSLFAVLVIVASRTAYRLIGLVEIMGTLGSLSLSAILALLYLNMSGTQEIQARILADQRDLHEAEISGDLRVDNVAFSGNKFEIWISNYGKSPVTDLHIYTEVFPNNAENVEFAAGKHLLVRQTSEELESSRVNAIGPGEKEIKFTGKPVVHLASEDDHPMAPDLCMAIYEMKHELEIEKIDCRFWVEGSDQLGTTHQDKLFRFDRHLNLRQVDDHVSELENVFTGSMLGKVDDRESEYNG